MKIGEICKRHVITTTKDSTAHELAYLMAKDHVGSVVIVEKQAAGMCPIGIVTDRDLALKVIANKLDPNICTAENLMNEELITGYLSSGVTETMRHMRRNGIRRLPVVDHNQVLAGIITIDDLIDVVMSELSELSETITSGHYKERLRVQTING